MGICRKWQFTSVVLCSQSFERLAPQATMTVSFLFYASMQRLLFETSEWEGEDSGGGGGGDTSGGKQGGGASSLCLSSGSHVEADASFCAAEACSVETVDHSGAGM